MTTVGSGPVVVKRQHIRYALGMSKDDALKRVSRAAKARARAQAEFIKALEEAEPLASWAEIAKAAGGVDRASLFKLLRRNSDAS